MEISKSFFALWAPRVLGIVRIVTGFLYLQHGTAKFFGVPHVAALDGVQLFSIFGFAGVLELVFGTLVMLGLFTRLSALILSGEMAVAYFMFHAPHGLMPLQNQGEPAVLFCFIFLYFAAAGGGAFSIDAARRRRDATHDFTRTKIM
jgi:putative oxidoreductase